MIGSKFTPSEELNKLGFRLALFHSWPLEKAVKTLAEMGYKSLELCLEHPELSPDKLTEKEISRIKKIIEDGGLRVSSVSYFSSGDDVSVALEEQKGGVELARELDCRILVVGTLPEAADPDGKKTYRALEELLRLAEEKGVTIAVEPEPETVINGLFEFSVLASRVAGSPLGLSLNIGHVALTEGDVAAAIEEWAPFIMNAHISDVRRHEHVHLLPGDGHLDIYKMVMTLRENDFSGDLIIDLSQTQEAPDQLARIAMERCREMFS